MPFQPTIADSRLDRPSAAGTKVNDDAESLLRYGLPINNKDVRDIQLQLENLKSDLRLRRINYAESDLQTAKTILLEKGEKIIASAPVNHKNALKESLKRLIDDIIPLSSALKSESRTGSGSIQERSFLDQSFELQRALSKELTNFEELLVPDDFRRVIPEEYSNLPVLQGRAVVEMILKKPDGTSYDVEGKLFDQAILKLVIDGYNAPITAGNFVDLVNKKFYDNKLVS